MIEDKQKICDKLLETLLCTYNCQDLIDIRYHADKRIVDVVFIGGTRNINVHMDSGTAMIRDIMTHLGC